MGLPRVIGLIFSLLHASQATPEEIARIREKRFRHLLRTAVAKSPFYRELYRGIDIQTCRLADLPVVDKKMMMASFDDFVTDRRLKKAEIGRWLEDKNNLGRKYLGKYIAFQTSGTTGENALVVYDRRALDFAHAALLARHPDVKKLTATGLTRIILSTLFVKRFGITAILMAGGPYPSYTIAIHPPPLYQCFVKEEVYSLLEPIPGLVEKLNASSCNQLYSYPSILDLLAREQLAGRLHLKLEEPLPTIISGSEPLTEATKQIVEKAWGVKVQDHYGSAECILLARSCSNFERMHVMSDLCCMEMVDRQGRPVPDGKTGEKVLLTNLCNLTQPFIRYEISDVTGYSTEPCSCGQPFPTLLPVEGRTDDIFYFDRPGGGYEAVHPYLFLGPILEITQIKEYQLAQTGRNEITLSYVPVRPGEDIEAHVRSVLENGMHNAGLMNRVVLKTLCVRTIERDPRSGKIRQLINRIGAPANLDENL